MRNTRQKELILSIINNSYSHLDAISIYKVARESICNISLGTVYRNLNILVDCNLIKKIKVANVDRFDRVDNHDHFICTKCNKIVDVYDNKVFIPKIGNNVVMDYSLKYYGICEDCWKES